MSGVTSTLVRQSVVVDDLKIRQQFVEVFRRNPVTAMMTKVSDGDPIIPLIVLMKIFTVLL